tara:strand:+ start:38 stop:313 length:276 start_codon:yes stop_codon:yes gene_type:complete
MLSGYWTEGKGASIETVAELIGDTPTTAFRHYGREWAQNYQDPLWNAIGEGPAAAKGRQPKTKQKQNKGTHKSSKSGSTNSRRKVASTKTK